MKLLRCRQSFLIVVYCNTMYQTLIYIIPYVCLQMRRTFPNPVPLKCSELALDSEADFFYPMNSPRAQAEQSDSEPSNWQLVLWTFLQLVFVLSWEHQSSNFPSILYCVTNQSANLRNNRKPGLYILRYFNEKTTFTHPFRRSNFGVISVTSTCYLSYLVTAKTRQKKNRSTDVISLMATGSNDSHIILRVSFAVLSKHSTKLISPKNISHA